MELEYWWLLAIPLFFVLGWAARGRERRQENPSSAGLADAYLKGLNFLLNDQPDRAIDAFVEVVRIEPEAVELHFALGALFRRRGETDRAIRVHRNLVDRGALREGEREHALFELGQDYLKAGLIDRAEDAFNQLEGGSYAAAARRQRLEIAQMTRDWPRVIALASEQGDATRVEASRIVAHAYCEQADALVEAGKLAEARELVELARRAAPEHPRPVIALAAVLARSDDAAAALRLYESLARSHPDHVPLVAAGWLEAAEASGGDTALRTTIAQLDAMPNLAGSVDVLRPLALARARLDSRAAAIAWLRTTLASLPSLLGMQLLLELVEKEAAAGGTAVEADSADRRTLQSLVKRQGDQSSRFICGVCGFRARRHYWQCPGCNRWDSYATRRNDDPQVQA